MYIAPVKRENICNQKTIYQKVRMQYKNVSCYLVSILKSQVKKLLCMHADFFVKHIVEAHHKTYLKFLLHQTAILYFTNKLMLCMQKK